MRYIIRERLRLTRDHSLKTVGYHVLDTKRGEKVSPNYQTLSSARSHAERLEKKVSK